MELLGAAATRALGARLAQALQPGDCIELEGVLGAGKTVFAKGLAQGLGIHPGDVTSPSFTLLNIYPIPSGGTLVHVDGFRLRGPVDAETIGLADHRGSIVVVEWGSLLQDYLPADRLHLILEQGAEEEHRTARLSASGPRSRDILKTLEVTSRDLPD